jgi:hypothetical protein
VVILGLVGSFLGAGGCFWGPRGSDLKVLEEFLGGPAGIRKACRSYNAGSSKSLGSPRRALGALAEPSVVSRRPRRYPLW